MKQITDYPNYFVTREGRIFSNYSNKWLKPDINQDGYSMVRLYKNKKSKAISIHRLVAQTFVLNPNNKLEVNHINEIKSDNRIENLEWCTRSENELHNSKNGGEKNPRSKLTVEQIKEIRENHRKTKYGDKPYLKYGIGKTQYYRIINKEHWT